MIAPEKMQERALTLLNSHATAEPTLQILKWVLESLVEQFEPVTRRGSEDESSRRLANPIGELSPGVVFAEVRVADEIKRERGQTTLRRAAA